MGGTVSAKDGASPAATTTATTITNSTPFTTNNTAKNMTCKFELNKLCTQLCMKKCHYFNWP